MLQILDQADSMISASKSNKTLGVIKLAGLRLFCLYRVGLKKFALEWSDKLMSAIRSELLKNSDIFSIADVALVKFATV